MAADFEIRGTASLERASRALQHAGDDLRREVEAEEKKAAARTTKRMKAAIPDSLPRRGGLAADVASGTKFVVSSHGIGSEIVVQIEARSHYNLDRMNSEGSFSHPVFGREDTVSQSAGVRRGFLDEVMRRSQNDIHRAAETAADNVRDKINRSV